jgi:ATP-dependent Clp protease adaptor protein ClpS
MGVHLAVQGELRENTKERIKEPKRFKVIMHNDDFTPMDFVVKVLKETFHKEEQEAVRLMYAVHQKGMAVVGVYSYDIASTKVKKVTAKARSLGYPFRLEIQE